MRTHEAGITEDKSSKVEDETAANDSIDTERQPADQRIMDPEFMQLIIRMTRV